jgi:hypothetical protein
LFAAAMNTVCYFYESQRRHLQEVIDKYDGIIRKSFIDFEFHLIITLELRLRYTMIQLKIFFKKLYDNGDFIEQPSNCMTQRLISSWQTVLLLELVQNVATKKRMEINVKMWINA